jgi:hypothetical protein
MRKMTMNCLALGAILAAAAPARADDQVITEIPRSLIKTHHQVPRPEVGVQAYGAAFGVFAQSGGSAPKTCSYVGGPKVGSWACR